MISKSAPFDATLVVSDRHSIIVVQPMLHIAQIVDDEDKKIINVS